MNIEKLHQEKAEELNRKHQAYKNGEIKFSELAPLIEEYRLVFEKYQKLTGKGI